MNKKCEFQDRTSHGDVGVKVAWYLVKSRCVRCLAFNDTRLARDRG
jgi:hypothetical protein